LPPELWAEALEPKPPWELEKDDPLEWEKESDEEWEENEEEDPNDGLELWELKSGVGVKRGVLEWEIVEEW
jgi:hypothetical protein